MVVEAGVAFGLLAGGAWGVVLYASKRYFSGFHDTTFMAVAFACAAVWYAPLAVSRAASSPHAVDASPRVVGAVLLTLVLLAAGLYVMFRAISTGDVSHVAPISKVHPVFVVPLEVGLLGEHLAPVQVAGVVVATLAVYLANYEGAAAWEPVRRAVSYRPSQLALLSALVLAVVNVAQRYVLQELAVPSTTWIALKLVGVALLLGAAAWRRAEHAAVARALPSFVALGAVLAVGEHFFGLAFATVPASVATPLVAVQSIVAVLLGGLLLAEERLATRLGAAVLALVGVGLIATG